MLYLMPFEDTIEFGLKSIRMGNYIVSLIGLFVINFSDVKHSHTSYADIIYFIIYYRKF